MTGAVPGGPRAMVGLPAPGGDAEARGEGLRRAADRGDAAALRRAAEGFEQWFVQQLFREMRAGSVAPDAGPGMATFQGMLDEELSGRAARAGSFGIADLIVDSLTRARGAREYAGAAAAPAKLPGVGSGPRAGWRWPLESMPAGLREPNRFGERRDPFTGERRAHRGVDLAAAEGAAIFPVAPGTVVEAGARGGYGNLVVVDHGGGVRSLYAHAREVLVRPGDRVDPGTPVARVGSTGRSTSPHLHLEVRVEGEAVDPLGWLASPADSP